MSWWTRLTGRDRRRAEERPEQGVWYSGAREDHAIDTSLRTLTPAKLAAAMKAAEQGDTSQQYEIFSIVEQDSHVTSVLGRRRRAVLARKMRIVQAHEGSATGRKTVDKSAELCQRLVLGEDGKGGIEGWRDALHDLTDAIGKGFSLQQIVWELEGPTFVPRRLIYWPQRECVLGDPSQQYQQDQDEVRIYTDEERAVGEPLAPRWNWVCHKHKAWSTHLARAGLMRSVVWWYLFKHFSAKDWAVFIERYGVPMRVGKYPENATDPMKAALKAAVISLGRDSACVLPDRTAIELLQVNSSAGSGAIPHKDMVAQADAQISKAIWGNTMASDQGDKGARSAKEAYSADEAAITDDDCERLAETIRTQLLTPIVRLNLGPSAPVPFVSFEAAETEDLEARSRRDLNLSKIGVKFSAAQMREVYGLEEPQGDEDEVSAPKPPAPSAPGDGSEDTQSEEAQQDAEDDSAADDSAQT